MIKPSRSKAPSAAVKALQSKIKEIKGTRERKSKRSSDPLEYRPGMDKDFYSTQAWRTLRYQVLKENSAKYTDGRARCDRCAQRAGEGVALHCDHKLPRSKFPHLELVKENIGVLCQDCNLGKSDSL